MISPRTLVFDLDGTLVDTAPDLINALNFVLDREGLPPVPLHSARNMIGQGARRLIERGLELEGRTAGVDDITRLTQDFIDYYAAHIADVSRPFEGLESALDRLVALVRAAARPPVPRKKTKPPKASKRRRLDDKKRHGTTKALRARPSHD